MILHGDAHADNLMQYQGQPVVIALDDLATGVPEIDLAAAYTAHVRFQADPARWDTFKADYGDADWELVTRLRKLREATMVLWLATIKGAEAELEHRLSTFDTDQAWHRV